MPKVAVSSPAGRPAARKRTPFQPLYPHNGVDPWKDPDQIIAEEEAKRRAV